MKVTSKNKNWLEKAYKRMLWLYANAPDKKFGKFETYYINDLNKNVVNDCTRQFTYLMSNDIVKKKIKEKGFVPFHFSKLERKFICSGRLV